ncbi:MAG: metallophosphoesterase [Lysobacter sp.]|nr:metallophosphoesterase [Lysobacter sp.]
MSAYWTKFVAILTLAGCGWCGEISAQTAAIRSHDGLRLGVIADTQLTTPQKTSHYLFRTVQADAVANVAVRTTAQEHLAEHQLRDMLDRMALSRPDAILYLGDGANSGCHDEVDLFFSILRENRTKHGVPIFFAIGNHDYLATGNQSDRHLRALACGGQAYYTKAELVRSTSAFNTESSRLEAISSPIFTGYRDSLSEVDREDGGCRVTVEEDQHTEGCFYAAVLDYKRAGHRGALVLIDTSDYRDLGFNPVFPSVPTLGEGRGLRGGVSFGPGSQTAWVSARLKDVHPGAERIFASHYPTKDLQWSVAGVNFASGQIGDLLLLSGANLWLSAHTHRDKPPSERLNLYRYKITENTFSGCLGEFNVGSTTDHRAHAAVVEIVDGAAIADPKCRQPPVLAVRPTILYAIEGDDAVGRENGENPIAVCERDWKRFADGLRNNENSEYGYPLARWFDAGIRLGLTRDYRKTQYKPTTARRNLDRYLSDTPVGSEEHRKKVRCLMYLAGKAEAD